MALPKTTSISSLVANVKANIKRLRLDQAQSRPQTSVDGTDLSQGIPVSHSTIVKMTTEARSPEIEYTSRTLDQEVDTVAICPQHNDYIVIGTYSLVKKDSPDYDPGQIRRGSIRVLTVSSTFKPSYAGGLPPQLDGVELPYAVLDIHFHPEDPTLLGVATSNARMHFFRFIVHCDVLGRRVVTKLLPVGTVRVADDDEHGLTPLVTQFTWFDDLRIKGTKDYDDMIVTALAATTSFGETRVMKLSIPAIRDMYDERLTSDDVSIFSSSEMVHKHDLEAWTVATVNFQTAPNVETNNGGGQRLILSGGDDSALLASFTTPATPEWPPFGSKGTSINAMHLWKDRKTHTAGVVSILPLNPPPFAANTDPKQPNPIPVLTGSYDEFLRIFEIDSKIYRSTLKTELRLNGGVWRLKVLDEYAKITSNEGHPQDECHYLLLASLMHAGAAILRITYSQPQTARTSADSHGGTWSITPLMTFTTGHESMVYSCDARLENGDQSSGNQNPLREESSQDPLLQPGAKPEENEKVEEPAMSTFPVKKAEAPRYTIVSTSFYDMRICTWSFVDEFKTQP